MWEDIEKYFDKLPAQAKVARHMLRMGLRTSGPKVFCGDIELSDTAIARAVKIDRRVVRDTTETISGKKKLREIFSKLRPTCNLKDVATVMGWGVIEIVPTKANTPGIIASVSAIIADRKISIRQVIVEDDPSHSPSPRGFIITERQIPAEILPKIKDVKGVHSVVFH